MMNQDIVSVLSIAVAALFLLITLGSLITNTPAGSKSLKISVNPFQAWNRNQKVSVLIPVNDVPNVLKAVPMCHRP